MKRWFLCAALLACGPTGLPPPPVIPPPDTFEWPAPAGWKTETIPFPLDFAPQIHNAGREELRFAPGFFDPDAPGYWSYAFVWFFDRELPVPTPVFERQLRDYFVGLTTAVAADAKDGWKPDLDRIEARLVADDTLRPSTYDGGIRTIDAFKTRSEVTLNVHASGGTCGHMQYLLVAASPKPKTDPMWVSLTSVTAAFKCR